MGAQPKRGAEAPHEGVRSKLPKQSKAHQSLPQQSFCLSVTPERTAAHRDAAASTFPDLA